MAKGELNLMLKLGQFIRSERRKKGLSIRKFAEISNKDRSYISKIENNKLPGITLQVIQDLLEVLDCDLSFVNLNN